MKLVDSFIGTWIPGRSIVEQSVNRRTEVTPTSEVFEMPEEIFPGPVPPISIFL
jgi:hypothetical protein